MPVNKSHGATISTIFTQLAHKSHDMDTDPNYRFPASPGIPLFPVSPERENRKYPAPQLPASPSMQSISPSRIHHENSPAGNHTSTSSVQGKVAQFNHLTKEAAQRRKDNEAALKRAVMGREEAENETRRLRETNDALRREIEEGRGRERRVGERLESVMVSTRPGSPLPRSMVRSIPREGPMS